VLLYDRSHLPWLVTVGVGAVVAIAVFAWRVLSEGRWPGGGSDIGLLYGAAAAAIIVFECLLWPRKMIRSVRPWGSATRWMRAHIWLGLLSVPLVVMHSGGQWWAGKFTTLLLAIFGVVILSGLVGLLLQQWLPRKIMEEIGEETIVSQIDVIMRAHGVETARLIDNLCGMPGEGMMAVQYLGSAAALDKGQAILGESKQNAGGRAAAAAPTRPVIERLPGAEDLRTFFGKEAAAYLLLGAKSGSALRSAAESDARFRRLSERLPTGALAVLDILESQCSRRRQLDRQTRLHIWLHSWLLLHLPLSLALLVLTLAHTIMVWWY